MYNKTYYIIGNISLFCVFIALFKNSSITLGGATIKFIKKLNKDVIIKLKILLGNEFSNWTAILSYIILILDFYFNITPSFSNLLVCFILSSVYNNAFKKNIIPVKAIPCITL